MSEEKHLHPLQILPFIGKYLFLLLLPLARGLLAIRSPSALYTWARGAWMDLLILLTVILFSYLTWRYSTFCCTGTQFIIKNGFFARRESVIPLAAITTLTVEAPFYFRPFGAKRVFIETAGGRWKSFDFQLLLRSKDADMLLRSRLPETPADTICRYHSKWRYLVLLSLFVSSTLAGVLFVATAFNQIGRILGVEFQRVLLNELETLAGVVAFIPRTAALLALLLLISWGLAFSRNLLHYIGFSVTRRPALLHIYTGFFTKRDYTCPIRAINFLDFRQSVLSRILGLYVVFIHCIGYGKRKNDKAVLLPAASAVTATDTTDALLWEFPRQHVTIRSVRGALWRYIRWPLLCCLLPLPAAALLQHVFPFFTELIRFIALFSLLPAVWRLLLAVMDRYTAGIGITDTAYTLHYARGFVLHTVVLPRDRIGLIRIRQSAFQKAAGTCDILFYSYNEQRTAHRICQVSLAAVLPLSDIR